MAAGGAALGEAVGAGAGFAGRWRGRGARRGAGRLLVGNGKAVAGGCLLGVFVVLAVIPGVIAPDNPAAEVFRPGLGPSLSHLLGTTAYGQDVFSQLIWGARASLIVALAVGAASTAVSVVVGVSAAYLGGAWDGLLSLVTDVLLVVPAFPLIVVIAAYTSGANLVMLIVVLVVTGWSFGARQLRSQMLSLKRREFLEAAKSRGERRSYIVLFEALPTMTSLVIAGFLGSALYAVLAAAGLQFVGLGDTSGMSWGTMLYWAQNSEALNTGMVLWAVMPGVCVALLGAAFALLNYAFDEIGNPALRPARIARAKGKRAGTRRPTTISGD
jgi:peptide/nickel transport system permease protein